MCRYLVIFLFLALNPDVVFCQVISTDPAIPAAGAPLKIIYDSSLDNGDLHNFTGDLYAHTGVALNGVVWQNVIGNWGNNSVQPKLRSLGNYRYELLINPDIRTFYNIPAGASITKICLVIRNSDGTKQTRPDIFVDVFSARLNTAITAPGKRSVIAGLNETIEIKAAATLADSVTLYINGGYIRSGNTSNEVTWTFTATGYGEFTIKSIAWDLPAFAADSFFIYVRPPVISEPLPQGLHDGINYTGSTSATLVLHAPYKQHVFAIGDFTGWIASGQGYMKRTPDNERYWLEIAGLEPGKEYRFQYLVDGDLYIADPYSEKILDPSNDEFITKDTYPRLITYPADTATGIVSILQTAQAPYSWRTTVYQPPEKNELIIYELLIRDFIERHDYRTLTDTLSYLDELGINAIELMPVTEFEGNLSWGYNPSFLFAPDKYYGPENDLKAFIDSCHNRGIAVILDLVLNHSMGQSPFVQLYLDRYGDDQIYMRSPNPWFNASSPNNVYKWGADFNHQSPSTQSLVDRVTSYWMTEYRIDGFRFDFSKGFTNTPGEGSTYDPERIEIIKRITDRIRSVNPDAYIILEHFAENSEEKELSDYGILLWGNHNHDYSEAAMGYESDLTRASWRGRDWTGPNLVTYMESHDEERLMYRNMTYGRAVAGSYDTRIRNNALKRMELTTLFFLTIPGPKMIWQFGELGYDISIDHNGRVGNKPVLWEYYAENERHRLFQFYKLLIYLRKSQDVFSTTSYTWSLTAPSKRLQLCDAEMCVNILGNFGVTESQVNPAFPQSGKWYEYFTGDSVNVTDVYAPFTFKPGEYRLYSTRRLQSPRMILGTNPFVSAESEFAEVYPNPSPGAFNFIISADQPVQVTIAVYGSDGKAVRIISSGHAGNGAQLITWDGKNAAGNELPGGIYLAVIKAGQITRTLKVIKR